MKRIDILKGIEQILVQKAYETGHISHRANGDWQKQADGSWIPYKGQSNQSTPQTQEPAENTEYGEIIKQDFESVPNSIKDKMFTIAQQYKAEWAEDSDEDMRSMAEDDVEAISQMLWDTADEETRNSWLGSDDSNEKDVENSPMGGLDEEEDQYDEITEEDLEEDSNEDKEKSVVNPKMDWDGISMSSVDKPAQYILENLEDFEGEDMDGTIKTFVKGAGNREQQIIDTIKRYIQRQAESDGKRLIWYSDGTYSIEKSAVRDMRSIPTTKNMGF